MTGINELLTIMFLLECAGMLAFLAIIGVILWVILCPPTDEEHTE